VVLGEVVPGGRMGKEAVVSGYAENRTVRKDCSRVPWRISLVLKDPGLEVMLPLTRNRRRNGRRGPSLLLYEQYLRFRKAPTW
jgi:hypothetical protein